MLRPRICNAESAQLEEPSAHSLSSRRKDGIVDASACGVIKLPVKIQHQHSLSNPVPQCNESKERRPGTVKMLNPARPVVPGAEQRRDSREAVCVSGPCGASLAPKAQLRFLRKR